MILVNHIESLFQSVLGAREKIAMVNTIYKYMYMYWYLPSHKNDNYVKYLIITYLHAVLLIFTEKPPTYHCISPSFLTFVKLDDLLNHDISYPDDYYLSIIHCNMLQIAFWC